MPIALIDGKVNKVMTANLYRFVDWMRDRPINAAPVLTQSAAYDRPISLQQYYKIELRCKTANYRLFHANCIFFFDAAILLVVADYI